MSFFLQAVIPAT